MFQVILFEGIPGSGKTTFATKIKQYLMDQGFLPKLFHEGDIHPIDLAWCSHMNKSDFDNLLKKYRHLEKEIMKFTEKKNDYYITAYTKIKIKDKSDIQLYKDFSLHEVYKFDNIDDFKNIHINLYNYFNKECKEDDLYIFECVLLQNHINELILRYNKDKEYIINYFNDLLNQLTKVKLKIFYLKPKNVDKTLTKIINERVSNEMNIQKDWVELLVDYLELQPYSKQLGFQGVKGVYDYYKHRQILELNIIPKLNADITVIEVDDNYDEALSKIIKDLSID